MITHVIRASLIPAGLFLEHLVEYATIKPEDLHSNMYSLGHAGLELDTDGVTCPASSTILQRWCFGYYEVYRDIVLVGVALHWRINSIPKALEGDAKDAAWALCEALTKRAQCEEEFPKSLPWVEEPVSLSKPLEHIWNNMLHVLDPQDRSKMVGVPDHF